MSVNFTDMRTETRMNRFIQRTPTAITPDQKELIKNNAINSYIDELVRTKVVSNI